MAMKRSKALAGPLVTPLRPSKERPAPPTVLQQHGDPASMDKWRGPDAAWSAEMAVEMGVESFKKLALLLEHYGIASQDNDRWFMLAMKLANDYVPGFHVAQPKAPMGRRSKWTEERRVVLYCNVMLEIEPRPGRQRTCSATEACATLAKSVPWKGLGSAKVLYNQFTLSRDELLVRMVRRIQADPLFGNRAYTIFLEHLSAPS